MFPSAKRRAWIWQDPLSFVEIFLLLSVYAAFFPSLQAIAADPGGRQRITIFSLLVFFLPPHINRLEKTSRQTFQHVALSVPDFCFLTLLFFFEVSRLLKAMYLLWGMTPRLGVQIIRQILLDLPSPFWRPVSLFLLIITLITFSTPGSCL